MLAYVYVSFLFVGSSLGEEARQNLPISELLSRFKTIERMFYLDNTSWRVSFDCRNAGSSLYITTNGLDMSFIAYRSKKSTKYISKSREIL